jgi:hypothetical protein
VTGGVAFLTGAAVAVAVGRGGWGGRAWLVTTAFVVTTETAETLQRTERNTFPKCRWHCSHFHQPTNLSCHLCVRWERV